MKSTKIEIKNFSRRFSAHQWIELCGNMDFIKAIEDGEFGVAEVLSRKGTDYTPLTDSQKAAMEDGMSN